MVEAGAVVSNIEMNPEILRITKQIQMRSRPYREDYLRILDLKRLEVGKQPVRSCFGEPNQAHINAACCADKKEVLAKNKKPLIDIVSGYNDKLSAHQPFKDYPDLIEQIIEKFDLPIVSQLASGVLSICDGLVQGDEGMKLSLISRDQIAEDTAAALSQGADAFVLLGICDKPAPGMMMGVAAGRRHLPGMFIPSGPMPTGKVTNKEKAAARRLNARRKKAIQSLNLQDVEAVKYLLMPKEEREKLPVLKQEMYKSLFAKMKDAGFFNDSDPDVANPEKVKLERNIFLKQMLRVANADGTAEQKEELLTGLKDGLNKYEKYKLLQSEMGTYHAPGTCTFYGTANTNQMLLEVLGMQLAGSSFVNPSDPLRRLLTEEAVKLLAKGEILPVGQMLDEKSIVNGIVTLMATGGSTNDVMHLIGIASSLGIWITYEDFEAISEAVPLLANIYPNNKEADINDFQNAGGTAALFKTLRDAGLLHDDVNTVMGPGLEQYTKTPHYVEVVKDTDMSKGELVVDRESHLEYRDETGKTPNPNVLRDVNNPFHAKGGIKVARGQKGNHDILGIIKTSSLHPEQMVVEGEVRVFDNQEGMLKAYNKGELDGKDLVIVVRGQSVNDNGMPELHKLIPALTSLQSKNKIALVTNGRLSGASGSVLSLIHGEGTMINRLQDGDVMRIDANKGEISLPKIADKKFNKRDEAVIENDFPEGYEQLYRARLRQAKPPSKGCVQTHVTEMKIQDKWKVYAPATGKLVKIRAPKMSMAA